MKSKTIIVIFGILVVLAALYFVYMIRSGQGLVPKPPTSTTQTESMQEVGIDIKNDPDTKYAILVDVTGANAMGEAWLLRKNGKLYHRVEATLPNPTGTNFYEGWLVQKEPELQFISTGELEKQSDGTFKLEFMSDELYEGWDFVPITIEQIKDANPEMHILEGTVR
jgi:hypothetical protein